MYSGAQSGLMFSFAGAASRWEKIGSADVDLSNYYTKEETDTVIANSTVGKKVPNGGEIFNDYEYNRANGEYSHAEGSGTFANGDYAHAEGDETIANGQGSHTGG